MTKQKCALQRDVRSSCRIPPPPPPRKLLPSLQRVNQSSQELVTGLLRIFGRPWRWKQSVRVSEAISVNLSFQPELWASARACRLRRAARSSVRRSTAAAGCLAAGARTAKLPLSALPSIRVIADFAYSHFCRTQQDDLHKEQRSPQAKEKRFPQN